MYSIAMYIVCLFNILKAFTNSFIMYFRHPYNMRRDTVFILYLQYVLYIILYGIQKIKKIVILGACYRYFIVSKFK